MRLCYFIMAHHRPRQFSRLLAALDDPDDVFIVHISARTSEATRREFHEATEHRPNVHVLPPEPVFWGHASLARQLNRAMSFALGLPGWDYLVLLSGQCFPIKSNAAIRRYLADGSPAAEHGRAARPWPNYVSVEPIRHDAPAGLRLRYRFYWILLAGRLWPLPAWRSPPKGIDPDWKCSTWAVVHRSFCEWMDQDPLPRRIWPFLQRCKHADEFWLAWCLMNGPFRDTRRDHLHYIHWGTRQPHPELLSAADLPTLRASPAFFARKFDFDRHEDLPGLIEERLLAPLRPAAD